MIQKLISGCITLIIILLIGIPDLLAQSNIRFENYTLDEGLPHNIVSITYQDEAGWIWVGTNRGLCRFDGESFKTYLLSYNDPETESSNINCIYEDKQSRLWIGTEEAGLVLYNRELDNFTYYFHTDSCNNCISSNKVHSITADTMGYLWLGTENGLNRFDPETNEFKSFHNIESDPSTISGNIIPKVLMDTRQRLWIGLSTTGSGLSGSGNTGSKAY